MPQTSLESASCSSRLSLARFPVALCLFDAGQSSDAERRCQPVAEKQGGLGAQLPVMSLHALPSVVPAFADVRLHNHWPAGASPPRGYRTNAFGRLAPNNLEASSRIGGAAQGLGDVVGLCVVPRSGQRRSTGATQSCAPTLPPPMAGLAAMTGMHRSDGLTRGKFAPNFEYPRASTPGQSSLQLLRGGATNRH
jgi:hypothetical protein